VPNKLNTSPKDCRTRLILDTASTDDAFQHREIANAIADLIHHEDGGCAIALTGFWGSGKSTVVELLRDQLDKNEHTKTFVFDTWAHQGDPLRRSFLEKLIAWCRSEPGWITDDESWSRVLEQLANRLEINKTKSTPSLTKMGLLGALLLLITPAAFQIYQKIQYQYHPAWAVIAICIGFLPAVLGLVLLVVAWRTKKTEHIATFFFTSSETETTSETSKSPEPTSVEFEKHYKNLLTEVLSNEERRILLVVDNLDRVNHEDAREMWAALRVFFDASLRACCPWYRRVWVLVPFDPEAVSDLWNGTKNSDQEEGSLSAGQDRTSKHFLDKTFQVIFRVPPIILSEWQSYLVKQLEYAFPDHPVDDLHRVCRAYDGLAIPSGELPTPRALKLFVNSVGALHRQWQDSISLEIISAFVLLVDDPRINLVGLLGGQVDPQMHALLGRLLDDDWQRSIAALYFNVKPDIAYQVYLSVPVREALTKENHNALLKLEGHPGFPEVLQRIIEENCTHPIGNARQFAGIVFNFSQLSKASPEYEYCKKILYRASRGIKSWDAFDETTAKAIAYLYPMAKDAQDSARIIDSVGRSLWRRVSPLPPEAPAAWCKGMTQLLPIFIKADLIGVQEKFLVHASPEEYIAAIKSAVKTNAFKGMWQYMKPSVGAATITEYLAQQAQGNAWDAECPGLVRTLQMIANDWDWNNLIDVLKKKINPPITAPPQPIHGAAEAMDTLLVLSMRSEKAKEVLKSGATNQQTLRIIQVLRQQNQADTSASAILTVLTSPTNLTQAIQAHQANTLPWFAEQGRQFVFALAQNPKSNEKIFGQLALHCLQWCSYTEWRTFAESNPDRRNLINVMLAESLRGNSNIAHLRADELTLHHAYWVSVLGVDRLSAIQIAKANEIARELVKKDFNIAEQSLHKIVFEHDTSQEYLHWLIAALMGINKDEWQTAMSGETDLMDIVFELIDDNIRFGQKFQDALEWHAYHMLSQPENHGRLASKWEKLIDALTTNEQDVFDQHLINKVLGGVHGRLAGVIPYYGSRLAKVALEAGPEKFIDRVRQVIEGQDTSEINWLSELITLWKPNASKAKSVRYNWKERVQTALSADNTIEVKGALERLLAALEG
jgi:KAP family P-loop domain